MFVWEARERFSDPFSFAVLGGAPDAIARSPFSRTLPLFPRRHLLHLIEDGSGSAKYCVCHNDHACRIDELHCHFHCEACGRTLCLDHTQIPVIAYPAGYEVRQIDYLLKGLCPTCREKQRR